MWSDISRLRAERLLARWYLKHWNIGLCRTFPYLDLKEHGEYRWAVLWLGTELHSQRNTCVSDTKSWSPARRNDDTTPELILVVGRLIVGRSEAVEVIFTCVKTAITHILRSKQLDWWPSKRDLKCDSEQRKRCRIARWPSSLLHLESSLSVSHDGFRLYGSCNTRQYGAENYKTLTCMPLGRYAVAACSVYLFSWNDHHIILINYATLQC